MHWWAWGEEALAEARRTNRPILLSVGYAACHWCHVMAHESFEAPEVAAVMNELFVNIKVDREERPDVDAIYMQALHLLGEHGGWPLTMFCTPQGEPFWGGTYFPYPARYGRPSFVDVLNSVARTFHEKPEAVEKNRTGLLRGAAERRGEPGHGDQGRRAADRIRDARSHRRPGWPRNAIRYGAASARRRNSPRPTCSKTCGAPGCAVAVPRRICSMQ